MKRKSKRKNPVANHATLATGPQPIPEAEIFPLIKQLRARMRSHDGVQRRDAAACLLGLRGLRIQEVCNLKIKHVDRCGTKIWINTLKGGNPRKIPIDKHLQRCLKRLIQDAAELQTEFVFHTSSGKQLAQSALRRRWSYWSQEFLCRSIRFHDLRHTFACEFYRRSKNLFLTSWALGHRSLQTTMKYLNLIEELSSFLNWDD